jgi:hypothetical protein
VVPWICILVSDHHYQEVPWDLGDHLGPWDLEDHLDPWELEDHQEGDLWDLADHLAHMEITGGVLL